MGEKVKIVVFVPLSHADAVRRAAGDAGAGRIGNYTSCSFSSRGTGRFFPEAGASPAVGSVGKLEAVEEERIEILCEAPLLRNVLDAIKRAHPYEEAAVDVYPLLNVA